MSLSCMVCCSWTVARSFLRCSHCCVTWLSFISCSSLLWLLISSDHSLVCAAVMSFTYTHVTGTQQRYLSPSRLTALWKRMQVVQLEVLCYLDFVISTQCLDLILRLLLEFLAVVFPVRKFSLIPKVCLKVLGIILFYLTLNYYYYYVAWTRRFLHATYPRFLIAFSSSFSRFIFSLSCWDTILSTWVQWAFCIVFWS